MTARELDAIRQRDREWAEATPGTGPVWDRSQLAEAYLLAGMDRHHLLRELAPLVPLSEIEREVVRAALDDLERAVEGLENQNDRHDWPGLVHRGAVLRLITEARERVKA